jgi:copper chaperone CopZ
MQEKYDVTGMTCAACQARVQKSVACLNGVQECNVNLLKNSIEQTKEAVAQGKNPSAAASLRLNASRSEKTLAIDPLISKKQITQTDPSE